MAYFLISPRSVLDWQRDWTDWLAQGDSITVHDWSIVPMHGDSPETPILTNEDTAAVTSASLQAGKVYRLRAHVTTAAGLQEERSITLRCDDDIP